MNIIAPTLEKVLKEVTSERKSLVKQQILMYKTAFYSLVKLTASLHIVTGCVLGTMVIQMKNQTVDIKVLIYQNIQCINI